jgi:hypothetical protein
VPRHARTRGATVGPWTRPVAIPDDVDAPGTPKATGVVTLPLRVQWSGRPRQYDLADRRQRALAYELVLTEGTDDDVRRYIDLAELVALWDDLVLPGHVRQAWSHWLTTRRNIAV